MDAGDTVMLQTFAARVAELNARDYGTNPFSAGFVRSDFKQQLADYGESLRWWKCFKNAPFDAIGPGGETVNSGGQMFVEKPLADDVKVLCCDVSRETQPQEFGQIEVGQLNYVGLPDEIELSNGDRVLLNDRRVIWRQTIEPSGESRSKMVRDWVTGLTIITGGAGTLQVESDGASYVQWAGTPETVLIEFAFVPRYVFLDVSDRNPPRGADGKRLLQRGVLTLENRKS